MVFEEKPRIQCNMDAVWNLKVSLVICETAWTPFATNFKVGYVYFLSTSTRMWTQPSVQHRI